jgi:hypothetical protein
MQEAIEAIIRQRTAFQDTNSVRRWRWELEKFVSVSGKTYLSDVSREDCGLASVDHFDDFGRSVLRRLSRKSKPERWEHDEPQGMK